MNYKKAKMLRRAAEYRNQSTTPGVMDFPGVARFVKHPRFQTHETVKTSYVLLPGDAKPTKIQTTVRRLTLGPNRKPIPLIEDNPNYDKQSVGTDGLIDAERLHHAFDLVPNSKPGRLRANEPKGIYRALKKLAKRGLLSTAAEAEEFIDKLAAAPGAPL